MNQPVCNLCNQEFNSIRSLSCHIRNHHNISSKEYYDEEYGPGKCQVCFTDTKFKNLSMGYEKTCSHSCGAILHREKLKNSPKKFEIFRRKVQLNQKQIWNERSELEKKNISQKISNTLREYMSTLTSDERKKKQGWMNKLNENEKIDFIENVMKKTGMHRWYQTASEDQLIKMYQKRTATLINVATEKLVESRKNLEDKELYYEAVKRITAINYGKFKDDIDPDNLRGNGYHLDHKFSIIRGYIEGIDPEIIGSKDNLEIVTEFVNLSKGPKCSIDINDLGNVDNG